MMYSIVGTLMVAVTAFTDLGMVPQSYWYMPIPQEVRICQCSGL